MNESQAVLVTTKHRGVFFGYMVGDPTPEKIILKDCRMCIFWSKMKGLPDLAYSGPGLSCRISTPAPLATIYDITAVITCTPDAIAKWESAPWG